MSRKAKSSNLTERKADPRPERTQALLSDALLELVQEKRWDKIRVQDILDRTGVGRSTFYAHFDNKFDLLTARIPSQTLPIANGNGEADLRPLFEHIAEMRPIMWPLMNQPALSEIVDAFQRNLAEAWTAHLSAIGVPEENQWVPARLLAGGFMAVAREWLRAGCPGDPDQLCAEFSAYADQVIQTATLPTPEPAR